MGRDVCNRSSNSSEARGIRGGSEETSFSGKGGKVRLSRPSSLFRKKPYDRPISSSGTPRGATSLPTRLVDTASNVLLSSASYLFETFFKRRRTLWIGNGAGKGVSPPDVTGSQHVGGLQENTASRSDTRKASRYVGVEGSVEKAEGEDLDLAQVERVLRRQTLSREQVNRLTEVLQASVDRSEGQMQTKAAQKSGKDVNPVQLAKAYMGECTLHIGGIESSKWSTPGVLSPRLEMKEEVLDGGSTRSYKAYTPAVSSVKMLKRRLIADDDMSMSREPVRRVRQKLTLNTSPFLRQISAASGLSRTHVKSLVRPGGSPEKVSNALEKPVPSLKGKSIEEPWQAMGPPVPEESPESSKARETLEILSTCAEVASAEREPLGVAPSIDLGVSSGKPNVGDVITTDNHVVSEPGKGPLATPEVPTLPPGKTKGFHMSALFEESSSDEEAEIPVKEEACSEVPQTRASATKEDKKQPLDVLSNNVGTSIRWTSPSQIQSSVTAGLSNISHSPPAVVLSPPLRSDFVPLTSSSLLTPAAEKLPLKLPGPFPASTHLPSVTEKGSQPINASSLLTPTPSVVAWSPAASSVSGSLIAANDASPCQPEAASTATTAIVAATSPQVLSTSAVVAAVSTPAVVASPLAPPATFAGKVVAAEASNVQSSASLSQSATGRVQMVSLAGLAEAASRQESENTILPSSCQTAAVQPEVALAASDSQVGTAVPMATSDLLFKNPTLSAANTFLPVATSPIVQFGKAAEPPATPVSAVLLPDTTSVANSFLKPDNQSSFVNESPGVEKMAEVDTMATDPMAEESETPAVPPPAPAFTFGSASNATSTGIGQSSLFGSGPAHAPVPSPFLFPSQSSAASGSSSSIQFSFGAQSSTPTGQLFGFGSSGSSAASSFSDTKSNFPFGASAATSASSVLQATSSASMTFSATAAAPSPFAFGAQASQPSPFGAQMVNAASGSAFSFAASPASSGAPSFQFGVLGAGTSMPSSQPFAFGTQSTVAPANPFTQSGAPSPPSPFQFGSSAPAQAQAVFPSGAAMPSPTPSPFSFGSQQPATPAPFTFGGQAGAVPSAQPFGFGGQPSAAASAQNPFASPAPAGQSPFVPAGAAGMEFAGAFSLGAAGGEKTGRKFIKAKRIGGAKRR